MKWAALFFDYTLEDLLIRVDQSDEVTLMNPELSLSVVYVGILTVALLLIEELEVILEVGVLRPETFIDDSRENVRVEVGHSVVLDCLEQLPREQGHVLEDQFAHDCAHALLTEQLFDDEVYHVLVEEDPHVAVAVLLYARLSDTVDNLKLELALHLLVFLRGHTCLLHEIIKIGWCHNVFLAHEDDLLDEVLPVAKLYSRLVLISHQDDLNYVVHKQALWYK